jgi:hypothetical protein
MIALAQLIRDACGSRSSIEFIARPQDDPTVRQPDISLARKRVGLGADRCPGRCPAAHHQLVSRTP